MIVMYAASFIRFRAWRIQNAVSSTSVVNSISWKEFVFNNIRRRASLYLSLSKSLALISSGSVGNECGMFSLDGNEILKNWTDWSLTISHYLLVQFISCLAYRCSHYLTFRDILQIYKQTYHKGNVIDFDVVQRPLAKELDFSCRFSHPWFYVV